MSWTVTLDAVEIPAPEAGRPPKPVRLHLAATTADPPPGFLALHDAAYGDLTPGLRAAAAGSDAVRRWRTLQAQIAAAEAKASDADRQVAAADAAEALLKTDPVPDLAARLRGVADRRATAAADRAAAESDLAALRPLARGLWRPAAVELNSQWVAAITARSAALRAAAAEAQAELARVVAAHPDLGPALGRLVHARRLAAAAHAAVVGLESPVRAAVLGPEPKAPPTPTPAAA